MFGRYSRIGEPGVFGSAAWLSHPAALAPYDHEPVQRVRIDRSTLDPAVSCPAGNADVVRFAAWTGPLPSIPILRTLLNDDALSFLSASAFALSSFGGLRRSDDSRAGRRPDILKLRSTSKSSRVRARSIVCEAQVGRIVCVRGVWIQHPSGRNSWIAKGSIHQITHFSLSRTKRSRMRLRGSVARPASSRFAPVA